MMDMESVPVLATDHLSRVVGDRTLVDAVSLEVFAGEVVAIVGSSGAGKSSFLRLLNRLDEPTAGTVKIQGQDYRSLHPADLRRRVGMVMQTAWLFPGTVATNLRFGPAQRGQVASDELVDSWLAAVGLAGYAGRDASTLSGGEAQRVSIARTLANSPSVLLLDEPTSALDEDSKREIEALLLRILRTQQLTCVMVTHDTAQAGRMADRVVIMDSGRALRIGATAEELSAHTALP